jgi:4-diphosphocytidyl-2-C-methyl-D-erythritol kinase
MRISRHSPAKVNLRLRITGRSDNGYHQLSMINAPLAFGDNIEIEISRSDQSSIEFSSSPAARIALDVHFSDPTKNLAVRAAQGFLDLIQIPLAIKIHINKEIPLGSGLGGGSSNAATVLVMLRESLRTVCSDNVSLQLKLTSPEFNRQLSEFALTLGADLPFFMAPQIAWVGGIGEIVRPLNLDLDQVELFLLLPKVHSNTAQIYKVFRAAVGSNELHSDILFAQGDSTALACRLEHSARSELVVNDLLESVLNTHPSLRPLSEALLGLSELGLAGGMSGSGSSFFCLPSEGLVFSQEQRSAVLAVALQNGAELVSTKIVVPKCSS